MKKTHTRIIGIVLAVSLLAPSSVYLGARAARPNDTTDSTIPMFTSAVNDQAVLADISNMTGVPVGEIAKLRAEGADWNQVLSKLKAEPYLSIAGDRVSRMGALTGEKDGEAVAAELIQVGFSREQIMQAKLLAERVQMQLASIADNEIFRNPAPLNPNHKVGTETSTKDEEEMEAYSKLATAFRTSDAISFMVRLQAELGGMEQVLNEYLLALQLELTLEDYAADPKAYEEAKEKQLSFIPLFRAVTIQSIEEQALKQLQESNRREQENAATFGQLDGNKETTLPATLQEGITAPLPDLPASAAPGVRDVKPVNPAEQIMKEIDHLNPNKQK